MPQRQSDFEFRQRASLSQQLADKDKIFQKLAGSNPEISKSIGILLVLCENGILNKNNPYVKLAIAVLDVERKADFATSEKTDVVTKLGLQMPKRDAVYDGAIDK